MIRAARRLLPLALAALALGCAARPAPPPAAELPHSPGALAVAEAAVGPLPADEAALLAGRRLYVANCATCHGSTGRGDDLYAAQLGQPLPDLTAHMAPGVHSDGQLVAYIRDGISGSSMPGYGMFFSEAELLQVAGYVRTFGQARPLVGVDPAALATEQARPPTPTPIPDVAEPLPALAFIRDSNLWRSDGAAPAAPLTTLGPQTVAQSPAFSPDGRLLAFTTVELPPDGSGAITSTLQLVDGAGGEPRALWRSAEEQLRHPAWAPDGSALYVTIFRVESTPDGGYRQLTRVARLDLAGGPAETLLEGARDLTVSADGARVAYVRVREDGATGGLYVAGRDGAGERALIADDTFEELAAPRFSPDGSRLLVAARGEPRSEPAGSGSPGAWLRALLGPRTASAHGTPWDIWEVSVESGELRRLTSLGEDEPHAVYSPDGREIALLGTGGIYRMDSDGGRLRRVDPLGGYGGLDWPPR